MKYLFFIIFFLASTFLCFSCTKYVSNDELKNKLTQSNVNKDSLPNNDSVQDNFIQDEDSPQTDEDVQISTTDKYLKVVFDTNTTNIYPQTLKIENFSSANQENLPSCIFQTPYLYCFGGKSPNFDNIFVRYLAEDITSVELSPCKENNCISMWSIPFQNEINNILSPILIAFEQNLFIATVFDTQEGYKNIIFKISTTSFENTTDNPLMEQQEISPNDQEDLFRGSQGFIVEANKVVSLVFFGSAELSYHSNIFVVDSSQLNISAEQNTFMNGTQIYDGSLFFIKKDSDSYVCYAGGKKENSKEIKNIFCTNDFKTTLNIQDIFGLTKENNFFTYINKSGSVTEIDSSILQFRPFISQSGNNLILCGYNTNSGSSGKIAPHSECYLKNLEDSDSKWEVLPFMLGKTKTKNLNGYLSKNNMIPFNDTTFFTPYGLKGNKLIYNVPAKIFLCPDAGKICNQ